MLLALRHHLTKLNNIVLFHQKCQAQCHLKMAGSAQTSRTHPRCQRCARSACSRRSRRPRVGPSSRAIRANRNAVGIPSSPWQCYFMTIAHGVFDGDAGGGASFHPAGGLDASAIGEVQVAVQRRLLRAALRRGLLSAHDAHVMAKWEHGGGFSVDAKVHIEAHERDGLERLLRYCARRGFWRHAPLPYVGVQRNSPSRHARPARGDHLRVSDPPSGADRARREALYLPCLRLAHLFRPALSARSTRRPVRTMPWRGRLNPVDFALGKMQIRGAAAGGVKESTVANSTDEER